MHDVRRSGGTLLALALFALGGCGGSGSPEDVIAVIDGRSRTVADLEAYLDVNLPANYRQSLPEQDRDRVLSRLFDNFLEEQLVLAEAERRGVDVTDAELSALQAERGSVAGPDAPDEGALRDLARVEKFLDEFASRAVRVSDEAVAEYAREHHERLAPGPELVVRSLMLDSPEQAATVHEDLVRGRKTFEDVVAEAGSDGPPQAMPVRLREADLPAPVREALRAVQPGQVSPPLDLDGNVYLFQVVSRGDQVDGDAVAEEVKRRARAELVRLRREQAIEGLLEELNERYRPRVRHANLPFRYRAAGTDEPG